MAEPELYVWKEEGREVTMTENKPIQLYCYVFGTVPDDASTLGAKGAEVDFYAGGTFFPNLPDIKRIAKDATYLGCGDTSAREIPDMASFTGIQTQDLYCYVRRAMHTLAGRTSSYGQIVICKQKELRKGDAFITNILGYHFLSEKEILREGITREDVEKWDGVSAVDLQQLSKARRNSLCLVAALLLQKRKVMLRLPEGSGFMSLCRQVMLELFTLLPEAVRPRISFSTCRKEQDFGRLGAIQLLLVDKSVQHRGEYTLVDLDAEEEGAPESMEKWSMESTEERKCINEIFLAENANLISCYRFLEAYYDPKAWWWAQENPEKRFTSYRKIEDAMKNPAFEIHPVFWVKKNWEAFCQRIPQLSQYEGGVQEMLLDEFFQANKDGEGKLKYILKDDDDGTLEFIGRAQHWNGLFRAGLSEEEFRDVKEASMITKETLKRVEEQKEEYERTVKTQKEQFDASLREQQEKFEDALRKEREYIVQQNKEHQATIERYNLDQLASIDSYQSSQMEALQKHREDLDRLRQQDNDARQREKQNLTNQLNSIRDDIRDANQRIGDRIEGLDASLNSRIAGLDTKLDETSQKLQASDDTLTERINTYRTSQKNELTTVQNEVKGRVDSLEDMVRKNASRQEEAAKSLRKDIKNINKSEGGSNNKAALILAIVGCALVVAVIALIIVGVVEYFPAVQYAKTEAEATEVPVLSTPTPTDTPEPTMEPTPTPAPTVVPYALGKYIVVCNSYALTLTEEGEDCLVYANDLVQVVISEKTHNVKMLEDDILTVDENFVLTVRAVPELKDEARKIQAQKLCGELKGALALAAGVPIEAEAGSADWLRQLLKLDVAVIIDKEEKIPEVLDTLLMGKFDSESMYLYEAKYGAEKAYLLLSKTAGLWEEKATKENGVLCRKVVEKVSDSEYLLYVFAADFEAVNALFPNETEGVATPTPLSFSTAAPTNTPSMRTTEPQE